MNNGYPGSLKIAKIRGVDLKVHFSLLFLLFYVVFVAAMQFPAVVSHSGLTLNDLSMGSWVSGFIFAIGLFASVALHEFGHVCVAQALGVKVRGVTLMMLGGVSEMERLPDRPYAELKLAVIGPIVSLALGLILFAIRSNIHSPEITLFAGWLANANIILAVFNIIPAFPMDGGRVLRSFLEPIQGKVAATQNSVRVSKVLAWGLGIFGLWGFNFVLMLIAYFIYQAADAELFMTISKGVLHGLRVKDVMIQATPVSEHTSVREAAMQMFQKRERILPVHAASDSYGLVTVDSLRRVPPNLWSKTEIRDVMFPLPQALKADDPIDQVLHEVALAPFHALPVVDGERLVGLLQYSDLNHLIQLKSLEEPGKAA